MSRFANALANANAHRQPLSRSFGTNETQQLREGQLVGRMMRQRLATGATGVKQARRAARHSYAHAQYIYSFYADGNVDRFVTVRQQMRKSIENRLMTRFACARGSFSRLR